MTTQLSAETERTCLIYLKAIASGEEPSEVVGHLSVMYGVLRPAIWKRLRRGGALPGYKEHDTGRRKAGLVGRKMTDERIIPPTPPVFRDPCPRCGCRGDINCGHSRTRLGMVL